MRVAIRPSRPGDGAALQAIERLAGARFREVGMDDIADADPASLEELAGYAADGRSWVAVDESDQPVGYVIVDAIDGNAHIEQVSVRPDCQGLGVGRALMDQVRAWTAGSGRTAITLTTFSEVPWNRPLYEHLGFRVLAAAEIGPELRRLRDAETSHGLDPEVRVCMCLELGA
jgi:ribosomal protein S18 acetylase RimI-like enzyme